MVTPTNDWRAAYNEVIKAYADVLTPEQLAVLPIFPSTIRTDQVLNAAGVNVIEWTIRKDAPNPGLTVVARTENRLDINDAFLVLEAAVLWGNELTAGTTPGTTHLQAFANPATIATGGHGLNAPSIQDAINGKLSMLVNNVRFIDGWDALNFQYIDNAQAGQLIFTASNQNRSSWRNKEIFAPLTPAGLLCGADDVLFRLSLPDPSSFALEASNQVRSVLMLRGLKIANGGTYRSVFGRA